MTNVELVGDSVRLVIVVALLGYVFYRNWGE
jgi:hypothetical protein